MGGVFAIFRLHVGCYCPMHNDCNEYLTISYPEYCISSLNFEIWPRVAQVWYYEILDLMLLEWSSRLQIYVQHEKAATFLTY